MKVLIRLLPFFFLYACSKHATDPEPPLPLTGVVTGSIKAYNKYGEQNSGYSDVAVKLIDKANKTVTGSVNEQGVFRFENVLLGDVALVVNKPGYGFIDSVKFAHQKTADTLTDVYLVEELPFQYNLSSLSYFNAKLNITASYSYQSTEFYWVAEFYSFSKEPDVSLNHNNLFLSPVGQTNAQALTMFQTVSIGIPLKTFTDAGFKTGDKVYASVFPAIPKLFQCYDDQKRNYQILHYKIGNASKTVSFTLNQ